jgi:hypothetical protein
MSAFPSKPWLAIARSSLRKSSSFVHSIAEFISKKQSTPILIIIAVKMKTADDNAPDSQQTGTTNNGSFR